MAIMRKRAQNLSEYAILLGVIIGAVLISQDMVKKALIGKVRDSSLALSSAGKGAKIGDESSSVTLGLSESTDPVRQTTNSDTKSGRKETITNGMGQDISATSDTVQTMVIEKVYESSK